MVMSPSAPLFLGITLGVLALFIVGVALYFYKKVKEESENSDALPSVNGNPAVKKEKVKKPRKSSKKEESIEEPEEEETEFLFGEDQVNITPQGVRSIKPASAPWNFSEQDKDRFGTPEGAVPLELQNQPAATSESEQPTQPQPPTTRRAKRTIEWD